MSDWTTLGYRLEAVPIKQLYESELVWFLDAVQKHDKTGRINLKSICNGSEKYCRERLSEIGGSII